MSTCMFHDDHDPVTLQPRGTQCDRHAVQEIHWKDGRISLACEAHGVSALHADALPLVNDVTELWRRSTRGFLLDGPRRGLVAVMASPLVGDHAEIRVRRGAYGPVLCVGFVTERRDVVYLARHQLAEIVFGEEINLFWESTMPVRLRATWRYQS